MAPPRSIEDLPALLTVEEAARFLRIGRTPAYAAVRSGEIPAVRVGRSWRIPRDALAAWLSGQVNGAAADRELHEVEQS